MTGYNGDFIVEIFVKDREKMLTSIILIFIYLQQLQYVNYYVKINIFISFKLIKYEKSYYLFCSIDFMF